MKILSEFVKIILETNQNHDLDLFVKEIFKVIQKALQSEFFRKTRFFGDDRFFISTAFSVYSQMFSNSPLANNEELFKRYLIEANRQGKLNLSRADLVPAMDAQLVKDSETNYLNASFHFINVPEFLFKKKS